MKGLLLIISIFIATVLRAQEPSLYFEKFTVQNGLSHNKVNCILQDQRGFIWVGTDDGLNRFDGTQFVHFRSHSHDSASISGNIITDLLEDKEGVIWIATADGGLSRYNYRLPASQQFRQYRHSPGNPASIPVNAINSLVEDKAGYLWLATSGRSVLRFNKKTERFDDITKTTKTALDLCLDAEGMLWVGRQGGGLLKINTTTLSYSEDPRYKDLYATLPHVTVTALFRDHTSHIWFGSWDKSLYRQNAVTGREEVFQAAGPYTFQNDEIVSFAEDRQGRIWMGGKEKGLHVYDRQSAKFYNFRHDPSRDGTISDNRINCIFTDKKERIWIGTTSGLCVNQPLKQQFVQRFLESKDKTPVTIFDFYEDEQKAIWLGTSHGIYIYQKDGTVRHHNLMYKGNPLQVSCFFKDDNNNLYIGTNFSLFQYHPSTHTISLLPNTEKDGVMYGIINSRVVSVVQDYMNGKPILLTSPYGHFLSYYDLQAKKWVSRLDSTRIVEKFNLKDNLIRKLYKTRAGLIWMATAKEGLAEWMPSSLPKTNFLKHDPGNAQSIASNNVFDMVEDEQRNLWVSTYGGGLQYFDVAKRAFTHIAASNNLVEGIQLDHHQHIWMISNGNLHKYDPFLKTHTTYQLPDREKTGGVSGRIFKDTEGRLYVAGTNYFISFHPDSLTESISEPKIYLTDFQIFNQSHSHLLLGDKITLDYNDNYFTFEFAAPDFTSGSTVRYAYQLEGFDQGWIDAGQRNYVSYSNLEGGEYTFKVRATNTPGKWSNEIVSMKMVIIPPYWKRPWFFILCAAFLALTGYSIYRYRVKELVKRHAIRNKIAQDLHDNVGSTLSSISIYSQVARIYQQKEKAEDLNSTLEKISHTSSEMISELNDTVWAINPRNDNMQVMVLRMESFARPLLAAQQVQFSLQVDPHLKVLNLEMEKRRNFYSIFKEAVNNVIKYAGCKNLVVNIFQKGNHILMSITDDGKGFELSKTSEGVKSSDVFGGGNGLKNMQQRAKEMNGVLKMESVPGLGTTIELKFPIT